MAAYPNRIVSGINDSIFGHKSRPREKNIILIRNSYEKRVVYSAQQTNVWPGHMVHVILLRRRW